MLLKKMKKESMEMLRMVYVGRKRGSAVLTHPLSSRREFPWQSIWKVRAPSNIAINICMDGTHGQNMKIAFSSTCCPISLAIMDWLFHSQTSLSSHKPLPRRPVDSLYNSESRM